MRSSSRRPCGSNRQSSTFRALAENSAKFVPRPSQVAPNGWGKPEEIREQRRHSGMQRLIQQMPVERMIVLPLAFLGEFVAHEEELLAGMAVHESVIGAQVGEPLPVVARHATEERALAMHDFVVRERQ